MKRLPAFSLHLISSRTRLAPEAPTVAREVAALEAQFDEAIEAGIDVIQIRERDLDARVLRELVARVVGRATATSTAILVSDRADVALAAEADGLHLPSSGMPADRLRALGPAWIVGRSIHANDAPADAASCDYLLFGTVFPSESKREGSVVAGTEGLGRAVARFTRPVVALGGVTPDRLAACLDAGAHGVAAIAAFLPRGRARDARGTREAVEQFRAAVAGRPS